MLKLFWVDSSKGKLMASSDSIIVKSSPPAQVAALQENSFPIDLLKWKITLKPLIL